MALKLNERYPGRFDNPSAEYPQGSFKNRTSPAAKDGSYLEKDWANDKEGFFQSLIFEAGLTPNGSPDKVGNSQYYSSLLTVINNAPILVDTGTPNTYTAINTPALASLPTTGYGQRIKITNANTGAATYSPDGLTAKPIYGMGLQPLQGGELPPGIAVLMYLVQAGVNGGNGAWIVIESLGGASQVAPATKSQHALQLGQLSLAGHGQCRLSVGSTTTLSLKPYNGNNVIVNGVPLQLPSAGVTYTASGLTASTLYYVYLGGTTAAPTLSLSTTGHSQAPNGVETKTGDTTLTLVGMVYTNASKQFVDTALSRTCLNWFNRRKIIGDSATQLGYTFSNTTVAEINTALRVTFLCWADDVPFISASGSFSLSIQGTITLATSVDAVGTQYTPSQNVTLGAGFSGGFSGHGALGLTEGLHFTLCVGNINVGGTATLVNLQTIVQING